MQENKMGCFSEHYVSVLCIVCTLIADNSRHFTSHAVLFSVSEMQIIINRCNASVRFV